MKSVGKVMKSLGISIAVLAGFLCSHGGRDLIVKPNIIYILSDDIGIGKVTPYGMGTDLIRMPNIERMAKEGVRFTDAYANAVCGPTRASLITGQHSGHCGHRYNSGNHKDLYDAGWPPNPGTTIGEVAQKSGYKTACFGKLGAGIVVPHEELASQGWDYSLGWPNHTESHHFFSPDIWENLKKVIIPGNNNKGVQEAFRGEIRKRVVDTGVYTEFFMTDKLIEFINHNKENPFFIFFATQVARAYHAGEHQRTALGGVGPAADHSECRWTAGTGMV